MSYTWRETIERLDDWLSDSQGFWWGLFRVLVLMFAMIGWFFVGTILIIYLEKYNLVSFDKFKYFPLATTLLILIIGTYIAISRKVKE